MQSTCLADHEDYRITLHQAGSQPSGKLIVTFGGQPSDLSDSGFGTDFAIAKGWDNVFVAQRHGTQYQGLSIEAFQNAVLPICGDRDVVSYGSSLGAYAALYFGGCIDARAIAAAPMFPAWRPLKNRAYADVPVTHQDMCDAPTSSKSPVVIFDPMLPKDLKMVNEMIEPTYPTIRKVELPHAGHTVLVTLSRAKLLKPLIIGLIEDDKTCDLSAMPTVGSSIWHGERARFLMRSNPDEAKAQFQESIRLAPSRSIVALFLSFLLRAGNLAEAQQLIDAAEASDDKRFKLVPSARERAISAGLRVSEPC